MVAPAESCCLRGVELGRAGLELCDAGVGRGQTALQLPGTGRRLGDLAVDRAEPGQQFARRGLAHLRGDRLGDLGDDLVRDGVREVVVRVVRVQLERRLLRLELRTRGEVGRERLRQHERELVLAVLDPLGRLGAVDPVPVEALGLHQLVGDLRADGQLLAGGQRRAFVLEDDRGRDLVEPAVRVVVRVEVQTAVQHRDAEHRDHRELRQPSGGQPPQLTQSHPDRGHASASTSVLGLLRSGSYGFHRSGRGDLELVQADRPSPAAPPAPRAAAPRRPRR